MKYKPEWKGRLRVDLLGKVYWDGKEHGQVVPVRKDGAKSPGGMVTNMVYYAKRRVFSSMTEAIESLLPL